MRTNLNLRFVASAVLAILSCAALMAAAAIFDDTFGWDDAFGFGVFLGALGVGTVVTRYAHRLQTR
jgi:hypothetical protein